MKTTIKPIAAAIVLALAASPAWAIQNFYLAAKAYTKTMPDGTAVPMWGYVEDAGGTCYFTKPTSARLTCIGGLGDPAAPGPRLSVPPGENQVRIYLTNTLPEPTSIVITGQEMPFSDGSTGGNQGPTWSDNSTGTRTSSAQRVRSFGREAAPNGGRRPYIWNNYRGTPFSGPGSFIYHSGTHPQKQVYMGLAGLITQDSAMGEAYPGVSYDNEVTLFYSDIDPAFNDAVAAGTLTTAVTRHPSWFLVNGAPFEQGVTADIAAGAAGSNTLLRMASTATDTHVAVLQGLQMTIHAEDGLQYNWQDFATGTPTPAPRRQYSAMLPPAKTKDAIVVAPADGTYAVYDGNGYMTNPSDPMIETVGDEVGGMLRFLTFGAGNLLPIASPDSNSAIQGGADATGDVLANDTAGDVPTTVTAADQGGTAITIGTPFTTAGGNSLTLNADGSYSYTPTNLGVEAFNYTITDATPDSSSSTLTITVNSSNATPVADSQAVITDEDLALAITLTASDDGQIAPLTWSVGTPANGDLSGTAPNLAYTPAGDFNGSDSFTFSVFDGEFSSAPATVSITVNPVNDPPVADAQSVATDQGVPVPITLTGSDVDGDTLTFTVQDGPTNGVLNGTIPNLSYMPNGGISGPDSFTFLVNDGTVDSAPATVDITVNATGTAAGTMIFSTSGPGAVPGVLGAYDDADVYNVDIFDPETNNLYSRVHDAVTDLGLPNNANIDAISIDDTNIYVSFAAAITTVPGVGAVPDEDVVAYNTTTSTWSSYFDGSLCGLDASNGQDIDAISVVGTTLYFSTRGGGNGNPVGGVAGPYDDADVYTWDGGTSGTANCGRALNATNGPGANIGLPGNADIDGLTVIDGTYYISFDRNGGTTVPGVGVVQDESVVSYDGANWALVFSGSGQLDGSNSQDVDAIHVTPVTP